MATNIVAINEEQVDLNSLFNFDLLKRTIELLIMNQKVTNQKIIDLEAKLTNFNPSVESSNSNAQKEKEKDKVAEEKSRKTFSWGDRIDESFILNKQERELIEREIERQLQQNITINYEDSNQLASKIAMIDIQLKQFKWIKQDIADLYHKHEEIKDIVKYHDQENHENGGSGNNDHVVTIVQNLERKILKKFDLVDDKLKSFQDEAYRKKNEITNLITQIDTNNKIHNNNKEIIMKELSDKINLLNDTINKKETELKNNITEQVNILTENFMFKLKEVSSNLNTQNNEKKDEDFEKELEKQKQAMSEADMKLLKDLSKKVNDLDRAFRIFNSSINADYIKQEINKVADSVNTRVHMNDFNELKEYLTQLNHTINFLKDTISQLSEDKKILDDFNWLKKKVENLSSSFVNIKPDDSNTSNTKHLQMDYSKFVDSSVYQEFLKNYHKEVDRINWRLDELKFMIDEIIANGRNKVSDKDLKTLEDYLVAKIEEMRITTHRKYADKNETSKNIKYLDSQIKHITEVYIKKMEKGDNWLLASKPIGGYKCASCESYLGELNDNNQHLPWNKIPNRDPSERLYRVGNGFSRMLQMLNIDNVDKNDEMGSSHYKKEGHLPRVTDKHFHQSLYNINSESINISADNIKMDGEPNMNDSNTKNQPKIVKIYKKNKENKNENRSDNRLDLRSEGSKLKENRSENPVIKSLK